MNAAASRPSAARRVASVSSSRSARARDPRRREQPGAPVHHHVGHAARRARDHRQAGRLRLEQRHAVGLVHRRPGVQVARGVDRRRARALSSVPRKQARPGAAARAPPRPRARAGAVAGDDQPPGQVGEARERVRRARGRRRACRRRASSPRPRSTAPPDRGRARAPGARGAPRARSPRRGRASASRNGGRCTMRSFGDQRAAGRRRRRARAQSTRRARRDRVGGRLVADGPGPAGALRARTTPRRSRRECRAPRSPPGRASPAPCSTRDR